MALLRITSRFVLVVCCVFLVTMLLLLTRCGLVDDGAHQQSASPQSHAELQAYQKRIEQQKTELAALKQRISTLEAQLQRGHEHGQIIAQSHNQDFYNDIDQDRTDSEAPTLSETKIMPDSRNLSEFIMNAVNSSEIVHGVPLNTEYDLIPFDRFTFNRIYLAHPGLGKRVVEKPIGHKRRDLNEVLSKALILLNSDNASVVKYSDEHFLEGVYRTEPKLGTHYELYFRLPEHAGEYQKLVFTRPFAPLQLVLRDSQQHKQLINLILPLSGRYESFVKFMDYFTRVCINGDKYVYLTVVYFGEERLDDVRNLLKSVTENHKFKGLKLITLNETFSRGRGLQAGAEHWKGDEVLLFLCDVDIVFTVDFLRRCRMHAEKGVRVYYPVVFSLYNPKAVYSLLNTGIPQTDKQLIISKSTGFWRDFGYGMTCQYLSDFLQIGGFPRISGWGLEDVLLYRKYVKSNYLVVRATDPGIFHLWHEKHCDHDLPVDQYKGCIHSKALNEAPHEYLGVLAFKEEFEHLRKLRKGKDVKISLKRETKVRIR